MKISGIIRTAALSVCLVSAAVAFTGCGTKEVDLNNYISVEYQGYDTVGTAAWTFDCEKLVKENPEAFGIKGDPTKSELAEIMEDVNDIVDGKLDKDSDLSNGDSISYVWDVDADEDFSDKYKVKFVYEDKSFTVDSLDELEEFDPFENLNVSFSGISPNGSASVKGSIDAVPSIYFEADKTSGLKNGDVVKVTLDSYEDDIESYCIKYGKKPSALEKEFTVEGLSAYVSAIDEIPEDMQEKMKNQAMDSFTASAAKWADGNSLDSAEFLGYYFLTPKEGFYASSNNEIYCVYKITANITGVTEENTDEEQTAQEVYYTYYRYSDVMILEDGTCSVDLSNGRTTNNTVESQYGSVNFWFSNYYFYGYKDLDSMFNECVTKKIADCNYESTVQ
ncbi:MAG: hypothetical protein K2J40_11410 [Ruminococcus sp.]|nr:hypothetical protein [Ruminococcus sp.]